jgi:tripartite-type tricarboxylate transporter receptor subunit TctC
MFPPGSGADIKIRFYANKLAEKLDATVVVDNKAGALGYIATEYVAHAKPDGLTIYIAGQFHARGGT